MTSKNYLYRYLLDEFGKRGIARTAVPAYLTDNLKYNTRPYQTEAFQRFILCASESFEGKPTPPLHLLFNMATGSGKTLVMAGLMLYLYEKGYRKFLFFVNSNNIIQKTKENFLNPLASKYLFTDKIVIKGKSIEIKEIDNFEEADNENINIHFTTIQKLHSDLINTKENSLTYEDFEQQKIVLLGDEAHHLSSGTKSGDLYGSWENTVLQILNSNIDNMLLEFTATLDYESQAMVEKYKDKVLIKYDLAQFRKDLYSKEINLIRSYYDEQDRILQALLLNLYRQELAATYHINLKPVILFKAKRTIAESARNKAGFHVLIETLTEAMLAHIQKTSTVAIVQKAFAFFENQGLSLGELVRRLQFHFKAENCLSANNDKEAEKNQLLLNTLEDKDNPIRAVFAVQKLNEGWDVLNLFDIVRLYEGQNTGGSNKNIGKTTLSEAQLIGRGARYFPFTTEDGQDQFKRKYDAFPDSDTKILEELYYHAKEDSRYISELKRALIEVGLYEDEKNSKLVDLRLKESFKTTELYDKGYVVFNKKRPSEYRHVKSLKDLGVSRKNIDFQLSAGVGSTIVVFEEKTDIAENIVGNTVIKQKDVELKAIPKHIVRYALSKNPFYYFSNISQYFPSLSSISDFISNEAFLGHLEITFKGSKERLHHITHLDYFLAVKKLLEAIQKEIKANLTEYEGTPYIYKPIKQVFTDRQIKVKIDSVRSKPQTDVVGNAEWYAYDANYGTSEEKAFVAMFARRFDLLEKRYKDIYLIRNEKAVQIVNKKGQVFEPDFILFCTQKNDEQLMYQVFIEPKGLHLKPYDKWKEEFLLEIQNKAETITIESDSYLITGLPFYNNNNENDFKHSLETVLLDTEE